MSKFEIGDKIEVIDSGKAYITDPAWAAWHGLKNYRNSTPLAPSKGTIGTVMAQGLHGDVDIMLVGIRTDDGQDYIIAEDGLELAAPSVHSLLTNGNRVRLRNGKMFTIIDDALVSLDDNWGLVLKHQSATVSQSYNEVGNNWFRKEFDIVQIYARPASVASYFNYDAITDTIWTREEKTESEKQLKVVQDQIQTLTEQAIKLWAQVKLEKL